MSATKDHILYIDDEQENLTGFKFVFKKNYKIHTAISAEEGWKLLEQHPIKVIISDQRMPEVTGVQFLEKAANKYPMVSRIILTAYTDVKDIIAAINKGKIFQFIRKPWDKEELRVVLDNAIKVHDLQMQNLELVESLKNTNTQLEEINESLESKVEQRTREVETKNKELEDHRNHLEDLVKQRTIELEIAKEKAEESDRLKTSFLANVSHEIRTPMNAIIGFSELMMSNEFTQEEISEFKEQVVLNSKSLLRLIDDIIDISRIEANQVSINYKDYSLNQLMEELSLIYNEQKVAYGKEQLEIFFDNESTDDLYISTDKIRLHQILSNLISNALKFTNDGFIKFGYTLVNKEPDETMIRFHTSDSGIGISAEAQEYIFDRFRKADDHSTKIFRGAGLGLFICKSLVEKFGGSIWMESEEGHGSTFYFEVPYIPALHIVDSKRVIVNTPDINHFNFSGISILVAEDEDSSFRFIKKVLDKVNAKVERAYNGKESIEMVNTLNFDLVLMDIQMPEMNGYDAIKLIKEKNYKLPIIAQTAYALKDQKDRILQSGCDGFISKPYKSQELLQMIDKLL